MLTGEASQSGASGDLRVIPRPRIDNPAIRRRRSRRAGVIGLSEPLAAACLALGFVAGAAAEDRTPPDGASGLRMMSLDLRDAPEALKPAVVAQKKPAWRTTFGSERSDVTITPEIKTEFDADVVLLQSVTSMRTLRHAFPAQAWRVIVSRQMLASDDPTDPWSRDAISTVPTTAIAVRYSDRFRVSGQEHLLELAGPSPAPEVERAQPSAAGTAVRLTVGGRNIWLLSLALADTCGKGGTGCAAETEVGSWRKSKTEAGDKVVLGGRLEPAWRQPLPAPVCAHQRLAVFTAAAPGADLANGQADEKLGCIARQEVSP